MQITHVTAADLAGVLALNEAAVPHVNNIDLEQVKWFAENVSFFRVARIDGQLAGFLIGLRPGLDYASENYRWFSANYRDFGYVDRVVVDPAYRRCGVASRLYDQFADSLRDDVDFMTCEVNTRPANESSMRYHKLHGFMRVATQETEGGAKEVALLEKKL
jgi:predicted GNAT superfamily acetyltransferase